MAESRYPSCTASGCTPEGLGTHTHDIVYATSSQTLSELIVSKCIIIFKEIAHYVLLNRQTHDQQIIDNYRDTCITWLVINEGRRAEVTRVVV